MHNFISSYCILKNRRVWGDGKILFDDSAGGILDDHLIKIYETLQVNYPKFYKMDNLAKLALLASEVVLKNRTLSNEYDLNNVAVVLSNAGASLNTDVKYFETTRQIASPALFVYTLPNVAIGEICIRHAIKGENSFFVFEEFDAEFISAYVDQVMEQGAQACLAGWVEVWGEEYNVFLYLVENSERSVALPHTAEQLTKLYKQGIWNN